MSKDSLLEDKTDNLQLMAADICLLTVGGRSDFVLMQNGSSFGFLYGWKSPFVKLYMYIYIHIYIEIERKRTLSFYSYFISPVS